MRLTKRGLGTWLAIAIVWLNLGVVVLTTSGCGDGGGDGRSKQLKTSNANRRSPEGPWAFIPLVPPLSFTGATFTDGDETRDVDTVTLHTWVDKNKLPADKSNPLSWTDQTPTGLKPISGKPTWTSGDVDMTGVVALAFVVRTYPPGNPMNITTTINFTQVLDLEKETIGLAECRITTGNTITNRVLGGLTDAMGPLGIYVIVDPNKEK